MVEPTTGDSDQESDIASPTIVTANWTENAAGGDEVDVDQEDAFVREGSNDVAVDNRLKLPKALHRIDSVEEGLQDHPAFLFLVRTDFYEYVQVRPLYLFLNHQFFPPLLFNFIPPV